MVVRIEAVKVLESKDAKHMFVSCGRERRAVVQADDFCKM